MSDEQSSESAVHDQQDGTKDRTQEEQDVAGMGSYVGNPVSEEEISDVWLAGDQAEQSSDGAAPDPQDPPRT